MLCARYGHFILIEDKFTTQSYIVRVTTSDIVLMNAQLKDGLTLFRRYNYVNNQSGDMSVRVMKDSPEVKLCARYCRLVLVEDRFKSWSYIVRLTNRDFSLIKDQLKNGYSVFHSKNFFLGPVKVSKKRGPQVRLRKLRNVDLDIFSDELLREKTRLRHL